MITSKRWWDFFFRNQCKKVFNKHRGLASSKNQWVPRHLKVPKIDPIITKFAFYCILTLQFSKASGCPGTHGTHGYGPPDIAYNFCDPLLALTWKARHAKLIAAQKAKQGAKRVVRRM